MVAILLFQVTPLPESMEVFRGAVDEFAEALARSEAPDSDWASIWAEPCLSIERVMRALLSVAALLILIAEPDSLQGGFYTAWTRVILAWGTGLTRKSRLISVLDKFSTALDTLASTSQSTLVKWVLVSHVSF